jgi:hypothetical protein
VKEKSSLVFSPEIPPDLEHASSIREEALEWLERHYPGMRTFTTGQVLGMAGEPSRRWLIARLRQHKIGDESEFSLQDAGDALAVLFLRRKGVKFSDAIDALTENKSGDDPVPSRYPGMWKRLIKAARSGVERRFPSRLLASAIFAILKNPQDHPNCMVIVRHQPKRVNQPPVLVGRVDSGYAYQAGLERPAPKCAVVAPSRELMQLPLNEPPARSEVTARHFVSIKIVSELDSYEMLLGTLHNVTIDAQAVPGEFVGRILDIVFAHFEAFIKAQSDARLETPVEPGAFSANDLQLWLTTQLLTEIYPGSFCEISESSRSDNTTRVLASSAAKPWQLAPFDAAKSLEMLSGYTCRTGVPLVVERVEPPWTQVIQGVEAEIRFLNAGISGGRPAPDYSALALPVMASEGNTIGSLYLLTPKLSKRSLDTEVRILTIFSRIIGETIERHREAVYSADLAADVVSSAVLKRDQFKLALLDLLRRKAGELANLESLGRDDRLPFVLVSAHSAESGQFDPILTGRLKNWLVETLCHVERNSFLRSHWSDADQNDGSEGFTGEVPGIGIMIALGHLVAKNELDRIRGAFPAKINQISPSNSPVKLVAWVLDVTAQRILAAVREEKLDDLAAEIENWAFEVATLVDDLAQSTVLAHDQGEWHAALKIIRQALQKGGSHNNSFLRRLAADCSLALADWPSALKYAQQAVALSGRELGSGFVRSLCLEGDSYLCLGEPARAWETYNKAVSSFPNHPLPRYYRGQAYLMVARLIKVFQEESANKERREGQKENRLQATLDGLLENAMEDLTGAADLLEKSREDFRLLPTLMGEGFGYELGLSPGPAASRLQSARRSFPRDDMVLREFLFAKCWEQGLHRHYADLLLKGDWLGGVGSSESGEARPRAKKNG